MDKLSDPNIVKKNYRKAMMMCHPDKINDSNEANQDKVFISNRIFSAVNEAFNEYKNEPGVNLN
jgi:curved DNA-binding protein CbpA